MRSMDYWKAVNSDEKSPNIDQIPSFKKRKSLKLTGKNGPVTKFKAKTY